MSREKLDLLFQILSVSKMAYGQNEYPEVDRNDLDLMESILKFMDNTIKSEIKNRYKNIQKKDFSTIAAFCTFMKQEHDIEFSKPELEKINQCLE